MKSNKVQAIKGFIVTIIIIGVILAIYYSTRTKKSDTVTAEEKVPNISISGASIAKKTTETYMLMTEYYNLPELSKQVRINVTANISDSYLIKTLKMKRTNGSNVDVKDIPISDGTKTVTFEALTGENMALVHTIQVIYTTYLNTTEVIGASGTVTISEEQLSLASASKSGDISIVVGNPALSNNLLFTKNYVTIKLGTTDIFPNQQIYFSPASAYGNGFKIMGASGNSLNVVNGKVFYILAAGNKNMIATTATETTATQYLTYTNTTLSLSGKTINFQNKLFDITFGSAVPAPPSPSYPPPPPSYAPPPPSQTAPPGVSCSGRSEQSCADVGCFWDDQDGDGAPFCSSSEPL